MTPLSPAQTPPSGTPSTIFVLCTGRCGSMTLAAACAHLNSHTSAHESRTHMLGPPRFDVPSNHIEIDNRLAWMLGRLDAHWGNRAGYVHLTRNPEDVAESFTQRAHQGIIKGYRDSILARSRHLSREVPLIDVCRDYVDTVTTNIQLFLRDKSFKMNMTLETMPQDFEKFVNWAGAKGDLDAAHAELNTIHNATKTERTS